MINHWILTKIRAKNAKNRFEDREAKKWNESILMERDQMDKIRDKILYWDAGDKFSCAPFDRTRGFAYCPDCLGINVLSCIEGFLCRDCSKMVIAKHANEADYLQILRDNGR